MERLDECRIARRALMPEVSGGRVRGRPRWLDGRCEDGLGQQRYDGGGCATMRERPERVESHGAYVVVVAVGQTFRPTSSNQLL